LEAQVLVPSGENLTPPEDFSDAELKNLVALSKAQQVTECIFSVVVSLLT
jgi:hypothetical protein